jgi:leucyl/phenylalanyl-tRNA--protein transferase
MIPFLRPLDPFPPVARARDTMGGLLAAGGGLPPERILDAYRQGIFPWGTVEGHPLWYSPDPRMVLFPAEFRLSRSLRKILRGNDYEVRFDHDFAATIAACAATERRGQDGTWISEPMMDAYLRLHQLGWAHSVETYVNGALAGGLYGLAIGRMFYGESMFSRQSNASKIAFAHLVRVLNDQQFGLIDCQMHTTHLASLGAREIGRREFSAHIRELTAGNARVDWSAMPQRFVW